MKTSSLVLLIAAMLLLSGCGASEPRDVMMAGFVSGDEGLAVNILQGAPPSVIQDKGITPFSFVMTVENRGQADVGPGTDNPVVVARLSGFVHSDFSTTPEQTGKFLSTRLNGATKNFDGTTFPGELTDFSFENLAYLPDVFDSMLINLRLEYCYDYESLATTKICVKNDPLESAQDSSICMLRGPREFGTSAAPIKVTAVEQNPLNADAIQIRFLVENVGGGIFFERSAATDPYSACVFEDVNPGLYKIEVTVEAVALDTYEIECPRLAETLPTGGARGEVRMPFGSALSLSCFITRNTPSEQRVYEDLVNIKIKYRYGEFVEVPLLIQGNI